jgi:hypothetical protein
VDRVDRQLPAQLFGVMALYHLVLWQPPLTTASPGYGLMMRIGMVIGFVSAWPANVWLIRRGWTEAMQPS